MLQTFIAILVTVTLVGIVQAVGLNDTGITDCRDDKSVVTTGVEDDSGTHPRQDCRYGRDAAAKAGVLTKIGGGSKGFDYSKIANDGSVLVEPADQPESAFLGSGPTDWACTRDNVTGLIWEVKTTSGLRDVKHTYSWYNSNATTNGGWAGTSSGGTCATSGRCDTEKFVADVNAMGLCGATDWRLPTKKELMSIVDYGIAYSWPTIDATWFPNTITEDFWSASPSSYPSNNSREACLVSFKNGSAAGQVSKSSSYRVRLVRAGQ